MKKKGGFLVFVLLVAVLIGTCVWSIIVLNDDSETNTPSEVTSTPNVQNSPKQAQDITPKKSPITTVEINEKPQPDETMLQDSLEDGFIPTQQVGEMGSRNGQLITKTPMHYRPTKYERIENSPLIIFTDDMIWKSGDNVYTVKRDAMDDQGYHYQEAAIALSISARIEYGQVSGYRFVEIPDGTLFSKLGMVSGDVLLSINGMKPDMEPMALQFINMVAGKQGKSTIEVEHKGKKRTIEIRAAE